MSFRVVMAGRSQQLAWPQAGAAAGGEGDGKRGEQVARVQRVCLGHIPLAAARSAGLSKASAVVCFPCACLGCTKAHRNHGAQLRRKTKPAAPPARIRGDETARRRAGDHTVQLFA